MAFDVRCPSCQAKMRFDDPPRRGEPIECPKCGVTFSAPSATAFEEKKEEPKPAEEPKKQKKVKTVEAQPRTFFNHWLLLLIVGGCVFVLSVVLFVIWLIVARAAKAEDMLACVPDQFNVLQGVNVKSLRNYPGVKQYGDRYYNPEAKAVFREVAGKLGLDAEDDLAYFIVAREAKTNNVLYLFGTGPKFDPDDLGGGNPTPVSRGMKAVCPTRTLIAVAGGGNETAVLGEVAQNARHKPWDGMHTQVGTCGKLASRGQVWAIWRDSGTLKGWLAGGAENIKEDGMSKLTESLGKASVCASWVSFGSGGVRFNAGLELPTSSDAAALVLDMKKGPLGKSDESTPPKGFKQSFNSISDVKTNGAFYQYLDFRQQGRCAYCQSKIDDPTKASGALTEFVSGNRGMGPTGFVPGAPGGGMPPRP